MNFGRFIKKVTCTICLCTSISGASTLAIENSKDFQEKPVANVTTGEKADKERFKDLVCEKLEKGKSLLYAEEYAKLILLEKLDEKKAEKIASLYEQEMKKVHCEDQKELDKAVDALKCNESGKESVKKFNVIISSLRKFDRFGVMDRKSLFSRKKTEVSLYKKDVMISEEIALEYLKAVIFGEKSEFYADEYTRLNIYLSLNKELAARGAKLYEQERKLDKSLIYSDIYVLSKVLVGLNEICSRQVAEFFNESNMKKLGINNPIDSLYAIDLNREGFIELIKLINQKKINKESDEQIIESLNFISDEDLIEKIFKSLQSQHEQNGIDEKEFESRPTLGLEMNSGEKSDLSSDKGFGEEESRKSEIETSEVELGQGITDKFYGMVEEVKAPVEKRLEEDPNLDEEVDIDEGESDENIIKIFTGSPSIVKKKIRMYKKQRQAKKSKVYSAEYARQFYKAGYDTGKSMWTKKIADAFEKYYSAGYPQKIARRMALKENAEVVIRRKFVEDMDKSVSQSSDAADGKELKEKCDIKRRKRMLYLKKRREGNSEMYAKEYVKQHFKDLAVGFKKGLAGPIAAKFEEYMKKGFYSPEGARKMALEETDAIKKRRNSAIRNHLKYVSDSESDSDFEVDYAEFEENPSKFIAGDEFDIEPPQKIIRIEIPTAGGIMKSTAETNSEDKA